MTALIEARKLRREYGTLVAVEAADLQIEGGQVVGLIGPNGAGKTTLLKMLSTLLVPTDGDVFVAGLNARTDYLQIRQRLGYLPDFFNLYSDLTLVETLMFFADAYDVPFDRRAACTEQALRTVELHSKSGELVRNLSRGMTQRLGLATLLVRDPQVLLLDEPASGLDPLARVQLRNILKRLRAEGRAVIVSSHILPELEDFCTDMIVMDQGRVVVSGKVSEMARKLKGNRAFVIGVKCPSAPARAVLEQFPAVRVLQEDADELLVETVDATFDETELVKALVIAGVRVALFRERRHSIEEVFMEVSGQASRAADATGEEPVQ